MLALVFTFEFKSANNGLCAVNHKSSPENLGVVQGNLPTGSLARSKKETFAKLATAKTGIICPSSKPSVFIPPASVEQTLFQDGIGQ